MAQLKKISEKFVLLCEGQHDSQFFSYLITHYNLPKFEICSVNFVLGENHGGDTRFTEALDELPSIPGFERVERVLIVADNDLAPDDAFNRVVKSINATADILGPPASRFSAPPAPRQIIGESPKVAVLMMPATGINGSLSTICWTAANNAAGSNSACVDEFAQCTGANAWPITKLAKMKLRALISGTHQKQPDLSVAYVWSKGTNIVPLSDPVFYDVRDFLINFRNL